MGIPLESVAAGADRRFVRKIHQRGKGGADWPAARYALGAVSSFSGNTSVKGAYYALLDWRKREQITDIAKRMTYIELSADNTFYDAFTSALFLPHTDLHKFPSVVEALAVNK
ncbi:MAG: ATP-binding protein [Ignavibacteriales bacterium]|nr:ATP-binding protein [Ignavibacteriales bacterium]